jgi:hypothetical protein
MVAGNVVKGPLRAFRQCRMPVRPAAASLAPSLVVRCRLGISGAGNARPFL